MADANFSVRLIAPALIGQLTLYADGYAIFNEQRLRLTACSTMAIQWFIVLRLERKWYLLWRSSVGSECYWQLIRQLKKEP